MSVWLASVFPCPIQELLEEVLSHSSGREFLQETLDFLVEHLRGADRDPAATRVKEFLGRYDNLEESLGTYVSNLRESIPAWKAFSELFGDLRGWLDGVTDELGSERVLPGNAQYTKASLENAKV